MRVPSGLSLIELLVAVGIAVVAIGLIVPVLFTVLNTVDRQSAWRETSAPAADALELLSRDLACLAVPYGLTNAPCHLEPLNERRGGVRLRFFCAGPSSLSNAWGQYELREVTYAFPVEEDAQSWLVRTEAPVRDPRVSPPPPLRERWPGLEEMDVRLFNGGDWVAVWDGGGTNALPRAARLRLKPLGPNARVLETEVFIPVGNVITPPSSFAPRR